MSCCVQEEGLCPSLMIYDLGQGQTQVRACMARSRTEPELYVRFRIILLSAVTIPFDRFCVFYLIVWPLHSDFHVVVRRSVDRQKNGGSLAHMICNEAGQWSLLTVLATIGIQQALNDGYQARIARSV